MRRLVLASVAVTLIALGLSGCSKCANWVPWYGNGACQTTPQQQ
jgi:hypothetical protein